LHGIKASHDIQVKDMSFMKESQRNPRGLLNIKNNHE